MKCTGFKTKAKKPRIGHDLTNFSLCQQYNTAGGDIMSIIIARTGELNLNAPQVTQEQRNSLWCAFVGSWIDKHPEEFRDMIAADSASKPTE